MDFILLVYLYKYFACAKYDIIFKFFLVSTARKGLRFLRLFRQYFAYAKEYITSDWFLV